MAPPREEAQAESNILTKEDISKNTPVTKNVPRASKKGSAKLEKISSPKKEETTLKISALISPLAKANLEKYSKEYGYKKLSPFLNDLLEHLDAYLD